jgi:DNA-binding Lrp family transcriptional regulator
MAVVKKVNDSIRVKILDAMRKKGSIVPNVRQIKKITGFHRATIKSSIQFLEKENFITGYRPLLDPKVVGFNLNAMQYMQINFSEKDKFKKYLELVKDDKSVYLCSEVISDNSFSLALGYLSRNIESHHINIKKKYILGISNYFDFIKQNSTFYLSSPVYKNLNQIDVIIDLLKEELAID